MIQIREGHLRSEFQVPGTRQLLEDLPRTTLLTETDAEELRQAYAFLSSFETLARLDTDTSVNALPVDPIKLRAIGRRLSLPPQRAGPGSPRRTPAPWGGGVRDGDPGLAEPAEQTLLDTYRRLTDRVRAIYETVVDRLEDPARD